jgi:hypothetical protein
MIFESLELEGDAGGSLQGRAKEVPGAAIRLFRTQSLKAGIITENSVKLDVVLDKPEPYTGDICVRLPGGMGKECRVRIESHEPGPVCVLGVYQEVLIPQ